MTDKVHLGHRARKRFGQNFLFDEMIIDKIVSAIDPKPEDNLVEIGPGLGAITEPVAELSGHLTVVELDKDLAKRLIEHPFLGNSSWQVEPQSMLVGMLLTDPLPLPSTEVVNIY